MFVDKLFLLIVCSTCLFSFFMVTISVVRFIYSDSIVEKFGIIFLDFIAVISVVLYLIFATELLGTYKKALINLKIEREVYAYNNSN